MVWSANFFVFVLQCLQRENVHNWIRRWVQRCLVKFTPLKFFIFHKSYYFAWGGVRFFIKCISRCGFSKMNRASHIILDYNQAFKPKYSRKKNYYFMLANFYLASYIFLNDSIFFNVLINPENRNKELETIYNMMWDTRYIPRFGRLIHGNENIAKDVLEYCVFEKHLSNVYGVWRLHSKIIPDWMPRRYCLGIKGSGQQKLKAR